MIGVYSATHWSSKIMSRTLDAIFLMLNSKCPTHFEKHADTQKRRQCRARKWHQQTPPITSLITNDKISPAVFLVLRTVLFFAVILTRIITLSFIVEGWLGTELRGSFFADVYFWTVGHSSGSLVEFLMLDGLKYNYRFLWFLVSGNS